MVWLQSLTDHGPHTLLQGLLAKDRIWWDGGGAEGVGMSQGSGPAFFCHVDPQQAKQGQDGEQSVTARQLGAVKHHHTDRVRDLFRCQSLPAPAVMGRKRKPEDLDKGQQFHGESLPDPAVAVMAVHPAGAAIAVAVGQEIRVYDNRCVHVTPCR
jgi:hypothetical protein